MTEATFVGLLHATREQLRDEPTREVDPRKVAGLAGTLLGEAPPREQSGPRRLPEGIQRATQGLAAHAPTLAA